MGALTSLPTIGIEPQPDSTLSGFEDVPAVMAPKALAAILDVTPKTLERWRDAKTGPKWLKLPGSSLIRYTRADVLAWLAECAA
ncbi:helix-turn-helix transcriptional regulator [Microbacterium allomyrinae]|nr:helix-turn-helix domain-containing protein [Microbacterium allomyrinae]